MHLNAAIDRLEHSVCAVSHPFFCLAVEFPLNWLRKML
jgi:hypothetical protein